MDRVNLLDRIGEVARGLGEKILGDASGKNKRDEYKYFLRLNRMHQVYAIAYCVIIYCMIIGGILIFIRN